MRPLRKTGDVAVPGALVLVRRHERVRRSGAERLPAVPLAVEGEDLTCFDHNSSKSKNFSFRHKCLKHNSRRSRCWCKKKKVGCGFSCRNKPKLFISWRGRGPGRSSIEPMLDKFQSPNQDTGFQMSCFPTDAIPKISKSTHVKFSQPSGRC